MVISTTISFLVLILLSAFFSSSETAYFNLRKHRGNFSNKVKNIINEPEKLLVTILTGNTFVNIALGSLAAIVTHHYFGDSSSAAQTSAAAGAHGPQSRAPRRALAAAKTRNASERRLSSRDRSRDFLARLGSQEDARAASRPPSPAQVPRRANAPKPWCATSSTPRRARKNGSTSSSA